MINKKIASLILIFIMGFSLQMNAHPSFLDHCKDMMAVFGFVHNTTLFNKSKDTKSNKSWTKFISSDMIDNTEFHRRLENKYQDLSLSSPDYHRLLFHWCYNAKPWNIYLERHIRTYCRLNRKDEDAIVMAIQEEVLYEQKRRNRKINEKTEIVFGFSHGGVEAKYAQFFASMAYNIHLLGDQMTDNKVFLGVASTSTIIGQIILSLRMLDGSLSKGIEKQLNILNNKYSDQHEKADAVMLYLKQSVPLFIKSARGGSIYRRLKKLGYY